MSAETILILATISPKPGKMDRVSSPTVPTAFKQRKSTDAKVHSNQVLELADVLYGLGASADLEHGLELPDVGDGVRCCAVAFYLNARSLSIFLVLVVLVETYGFQALANGFLDRRCVSWGR